ncbi:HmuY family protein [Sphingobacterium pedocola]|uniref:DUF4270 domain-containing protein n=1 Tax=Sphingobacterium pedocola TaxID=2082722 RepID=A0ABR9T3N9_9SPHI|nr:HmuY family protein [Sphingobacterium pedocola]MBE8719966.1 hypothetical protein [Sphingobacterium pedocola]
MKKIKVCTRSIVLFTVCSTLLALTSCGEVYDLNGYDWDPDLPPSDSVFNREIQILDLGVNNIPESHRPLDGSDPLFFSLNKFSSVPTAYRTSDRWDISFSGLYRTAIISNNGSTTGFGYGSSSIGGVVVLEQPYSEVMDVPDDADFKIPGLAGLAGMGDALNPGGHTFYTFFDNIFRPEKLEQDNGYLYQHMMYPLSEDMAKAFPGEYGPRKIKVVPRTIIIRTANGNYAKMEVQSFYKGVTDPMAMLRGVGAIPYVSFRYMIIKKDEKRFGFVTRNPSLHINLNTKKTTVGI